jgi:hypothetical protein
VCETRTPDNLFDVSPRRSRARGEDGFIRTHSSGLFKGSGINPSEASPDQRRTYARLRNIQKSSLLVGNMSRVRKEKKREEVILEGEKGFRSVNLPAEHRNKILSLFGKVAKEINFPASKAALYAAALSWWWTDVHAVTNITVHSICKNVQKQGFILQERRVRGKARILRGKITAMIRGIKTRDVGLDLIEHTIAAILEDPTYEDMPGLDTLASVLDSGDRAECLERLQMSADEIMDAKGEVVDHTLRRISKYRKEIEEALEGNYELPTLEDQVEKHLNIIQNAGVLTVRQATLLEKTARGMTENLERNKVAGKSRHITATAVAWLSLLYHGIDMELGEISRVLNASKSTVSNRVQQVANLLGVQTTKSALQFLRERGGEEENRSKKMAAVLKRSECISDRIHRKIAECIEGRRWGRLKELCKLLLREGASGTFGFLIPTERGSALFELGPAVSFDHTEEDLVKIAFEELKKLYISSSKAGYVAVRYFVVKLLLEDGGKVSVGKIKEAVSRLEFFDEGDSGYYKYYALKVHKSVNGQKIHTLDEYASRLIKRDGDRLYISANLRPYLAEVFSPFELFSDLCKLGRFLDDRCRNAFRSLKVAVNEIQERYDAPKEDAPKEDAPKEDAPRGGETRDAIPELRGDEGRGEVIARLRRGEVPYKRVRDVLRERFPDLRGRTQKALNSIIYKEAKKRGVVMN